MTRDTFKPKGSAAGTDVLVALADKWEQEIAAYDAQLEDHDPEDWMAGQRQCLAELREALAEQPAEGGQGEAVKWERRTVNKKTGSVHYDWCACSQAEFDIGSTEGSTLRVEYRALYTAPPAANSGV